TGKAGTRWCGCGGAEAGRACSDAVCAAMIGAEGTVVAEPRPGMRLSGKVAIVIGAGQGPGEGMGNGMRTVNVRASSERHSLSPSFGWSRSFRGDRRCRLTVRRQPVDNRLPGVPALEHEPRKVNHAAGVAPRRIVAAP